MVSRRSLLGACIALGSPSVVHADLYDDYINSVSKKPFIAFLARSGSTSTIGHAFVGVGIELEAGLLVYERFFGLYPRDGALAGLKSVFSQQSGKLDRTWEDTVWDVELRRFVDANQKAEVMARFAEWSGSAPKYSLTENGGMNCNGLVGAIAKIAGLKVPGNAGSTRPWKYIAQLKALNPP